MLIGQIIGQCEMGGLSDLQYGQVFFKYVQIQRQRSIVHDKYKRLKPAKTLSKKSIFRYSPIPLCKSCS